MDNDGQISNDRLCSHLDDPHRDITATSDFMATFSTSRYSCVLGILRQPNHVQCRDCWRNYKCLSMFFPSTNKIFFWIIWFWLLLMVGLNPFASCATEITEILASSQQHTSCDQKIWSDDNCRCFSAKGSLCFLLRESSIAKVIWLPLAYSKWTTRR